MNAALNAAPESTDLAEGSLPLDVVYHVLSNQRRRRLLRLLQADDGPVTLGGLAEHLASSENDKSRAELTSAERKRVYIALYQVHLPKLDDAGIVDFDHDRKTVRIDQNFQQVIEYLPPNSEAETSTHRRGESVWSVVRWVGRWWRGRATARSGRRPEPESADD